MIEIPITFYSFLSEYFQKKGYKIGEEVDEEGNPTLCTLLAIKDRTDGYQDVIQVNVDIGQFVFGIVKSDDRDDYTHCFSIDMFCLKPCDHTAGIDDRIPALVDLYVEAGMALLQKTVPIVQRRLE